MDRFYLESKNRHFEASWESIPIVEGVGQTPLEAMANLQKELVEVLSSTSKLIEVGRFIVESCLSTMQEWEKELNNET